MSVITVTTVTTVTTITAMGLIGSISVLAISCLIAFLVAKELLSNHRDARFRLINKYLNVGVIPLMMVFTMIMALKVLDALR